MGTGEAGRGEDAGRAATAEAWVRRVGLVLGPVALLAFALVPSGLSDLPGHGNRAALAAGVASLMAIWWLTEALPIAWTACVPLVAYPVLGVHGRGFVGGVVASSEPYADAYIFMFLGGMAIGAAMEERNLHRRIALHVMRSIGVGPRRLLLGVLVATALVSLWISNTATAVMMLPIAIALLRSVEATEGRPLRHFGGAIMMGVAYAANVGGVGTKIGSGTNSIFCGFVSEAFGHEIDFLSYMAFGLPFVALFLPVIWLLLWMEARRDGVGAGPGRDVLDAEIAALGPLVGLERRVAIVFAIAAALWVAGDPIRALWAPSVSALLGGVKIAGKHHEAAVAVIAATTLLASGALTIRALARIPWGTLLLLGGSFSMAEGITASGLATWMQRALADVAALPPIAQIGVAAASTVALSAVASNTAAVNVVLHVLPRNLAALSATVIGASCDFALPAGTPPNAIVFGSGMVRLRTMMRVGVILDVLAVLAITAYVAVWGARALGFAGE